ncbi:CP2 transcription factor-domain-containing protein [Parasitella parasitica]|nr:CP2 transcription factor-domain-containing protein [Parasitella parasitica]
MLPPTLASSNYNTISPFALNGSAEFDKQSSRPRRLRFEIVLEAATAVTQKAEESAITYLNRGQVYGIQLNDKQGCDQVTTSTLSIAFHSSSHRRIAESYWKFWVGQQKQSEARAIDIDASQSVGISNLKFPSFDKISFDWNGKYGAKILVRFKCLSTDFSRIKGVKGIPLRTQMETHIDADLVTGVPEFAEVCFCKVKLFRDKGAERKNKDDAKQISKQLEKVYGKASEQSLPLMYNVSLPYSIFGEIPTSSTLDTFEHAADDSTFSMQLKKAARYHTRVMTAPNPLFNRSTIACKPSSPLAAVKIEENEDMSCHEVASSVTAATTTTTTAASVSASSTDAINATALSPPLSSTPIPNDFSTAAFASKTEENYDFYSYLTQQQQALSTLPNIDTNELSLENASQSSQPQLLEANFEDLGTTPFDEDLPPLSADTLLYTPNTMHATPVDYHDHNHAMTTFEKSFYANNNLLTPDLIMDPPSAHNTINTFIYGQQSLSMSATASTKQQQETPAMAFNSASIYDVFTPEEIQQPPESCSITPTKDEKEGSASSQNNESLQQRDYFCSMESTSSHITLLQQQLQLHNETASNIILNSNALTSMLLLSSPPASHSLQQQQQQHNGSGVARRKSASSIKKQQGHADYNSDSSSASGSSHQSLSKKRRYYSSCPI